MVNWILSWILLTVCHYNAYNLACCHLRHFHTTLLNLSPAHILVSCIRLPEWGLLSLLIQNQQEVEKLLVCLNKLNMIDSLAGLFFCSCCRLFRLSYSTRQWYSRGIRCWEIPNSATGHRHRWPKPLLQKLSWIHNNEGDLTRIVQKIMSLFHFPSIQIFIVACSHLLIHIIIDSSSSREKNNETLFWSPFCL